LEGNSRWVAHIRNAIATSIPAIAMLYVRCCRRSRPHCLTSQPRRAAMANS
jgi:hypothetical protein